MISTVSPRRNDSSSPSYNFTIHGVEHPLPRCSSQGKGRLRPNSSAVFGEIPALWAGPSTPQACAAAAHVAVAALAQARGGPAAAVAAVLAATRGGHRGGS